MTLKKLYKEIVQQVENYSNGGINFLEVLITHIYFLFALICCSGFVLASDISFYTRCSELPKDLKDSIIRKVAEDWAGCHFTSVFVPKNGNNVEARDIVCFFTERSMVLDSEHRKKIRELLGTSCESFFRVIGEAEKKRALQSEIFDYRCFDYSSWCGVNLKNLNGKKVITGASFKDAFFPEVLFENISFEGCNFQRAILSRCSFKNVSFFQCSFLGALVLGSKELSSNYVFSKGSSTIKISSEYISSCLPYSLNSQDKALCEKENVLFGECTTDKKLGVNDRELISDIFNGFEKDIKKVLSRYSFLAERYRKRIVDMQKKLGKPQSITEESCEECTKFPNKISALIDSCVSRVSKRIVRYFCIKKLTISDEKLNIILQAILDKDQKKLKRYETIIQLLKGCCENHETKN